MTAEDASTVNVNGCPVIGQHSNQPQSKVGEIIQVYGPIHDRFYSDVIAQIDDNGKPHTYYDHDYRKGTYPDEERWKNDLSPLSKNNTTILAHLA